MEIDSIDSLKVFINREYHETHKSILSCFRCQAVKECDGSFMSIYLLSDLPSIEGHMGCVHHLLSSEHYVYWTGCYCCHWTHHYRHKHTCPHFHSLSIFFFFFTRQYKHSTHFIQPELKTSVGYIVTHIQMTSFI